MIFIEQNYLVTEMVSRWGMSEAFGVQIIPDREMSADALAKKERCCGGGYS